MALNDNAQKWVAALKSGEFKQTAGRLRKDTNYCCLGVACEIYHRETSNGHWTEFDEFAGAELDVDDVSLPIRVRDWLGLTDENGEYKVYEEFESLAIQNDSGKSFTEIADIIESEPEGLFTNG